MTSQLKTKRIDSFLFCCSLQTGGIFLGWFGIITSILTLVLTILMIVLLLESVITDEGLQQMGFGDQTSINTEYMKIIRSVLVVVSVFAIIFAIIFFIISIYLIRGTKNQNPKQVLPSVVFFAVSVFSSILSLGTLKMFTVLNAVFSIYAFVIVYSLWRKFQETEVEVSKEVPTAPTTTIEQDGN